MTKLFGFIGANVGGWVGWYVGAPGGMFVAFVVSMLGTGAGVYAGRRLAAHFGG